MALARRSLLVLASLVLAGCTMPAPGTAEGKAYEDPGVVTGSHVPRKATPGVEAIDGDALRAQGQIAPGRGVAGLKGQQ